MILEAKPTYIIIRAKEKHEEIYEARMPKHELDRPFLKDELNRACRNVKDNSSPGPDQIEYKIIKELSSALMGEILNLLNYCYNKGLQFEEWKEHQTIFVEKIDRERVRLITLYHHLRGKRSERK